MPEPATVAGSAAPRPRPVVNDDNEFFWAGVHEHRLLVQRCDSCGRLRHPPGPMCPGCQSLAWTAEPMSGRGVLYSYVVFHHPRLSGFEPPYLVALAEMQEGWRLVATLAGTPGEEPRIGSPLETCFTAVEPDLVLPQFRLLPTQAR